MITHILLCGMKKNFMIFIFGRVIKEIPSVCCFVLISREDVTKELLVVAIFCGFHVLIAIYDARIIHI